MTAKPRPVYPSDHTPERLRAKAEWMRAYRKRLRHDVIVAYGGKCVDCGETREELIELDHADGLGNTDRHEVFGYGHASPGWWNYYLYLKQLGYPQGKICLRCEPCHTKKHPNRLPKDQRRGSPAMQYPLEWNEERDKVDPVPF